jgi:hypothetical protein
MLLERPHRLLHVTAAGNAEAEMVKAHPVRAEPVTGWRRRPQTHEQVAADHDHAAKQDLERLGGRRVARRW